MAKYFNLAQIITISSAFVIFYFLNQHHKFFNFKVLFYNRLTSNRGTKALLLRQRPKLAWNGTLYDCGCQPSTLG